MQARRQRAAVETLAVCADLAGDIDAQCRMLEAVRKRQPLTERERGGEQDESQMDVTAHVATILNAVARCTSWVPRACARGISVCPIQGRILPPPARCDGRSEEHTSELQSLMRISYAV